MELNSALLELGHAAAQRETRPGHVAGSEIEDEKARGGNGHSPKIARPAGGAKAHCPGNRGLAAESQTRSAGYGGVN